MVAQIDSSHISSNAIYLEAAGAGGYGSLNYERVCYSQKKIMIALRIGTGTYHLQDYTNAFNPDVLIPLAINACYGKRHKVECSIGQTIANIVHASETSFKPTRITSLHTNFSIGYRYQKEIAGLFFRCAYTPVLELNRYFRHWAGVSIGYSF